jgi:2-phospho-L-lactate guanylyltransferase
MTPEPFGLIAAVPVKPFGVAKKRLSAQLNRDQRARLGKAIAARTAMLSRQAGVDVLVVTGDDQVAKWASGLGFAVLAEGPAPTLDGAAHTVARTAAAQKRRWVIVHADLPLATAADLRAVFAIASEGAVVVPSHDGGTNLLAGSGPGFPFSYGPGSFCRHLAATPEATVIVNPRLAMDLDTPHDLAHARRAAGGSWLAPFLLPPQPAEPSRPESAGVGLRLNGNAL